MVPGTDHLKAVWELDLFTRFRVIVPLEPLVLIIIVIDAIMHYIK